MKIYLLRPKEYWTPWYNKAFGFIVCAKSPKAARELASQDCGDEGQGVWLDRKYTTCKELKAKKNDTEKVILRDYAAT